MRYGRFQVFCDCFLSKLSLIFGAGIKNPPDLARLQPYLSSKPMFFVLDNAETILDTEVADAEAILHAPIHQRDCGFSVTFSIPRYARRVHLQFLDGYRLAGRCSSLDIIAIINTINMNTVNLIMVHRWVHQTTSDPKAYWST